MKKSLFFGLAALVLSAGTALSDNYSGLGSTQLLDPAVAADVQKQLSLTFGSGEQVKYHADGSALVVDIAAGEAAWPGVIVTPRNGSTWDLSNYACIEAKLTNLGDEKCTIVMRLDPPRDAGTPGNAFNAEQVTLEKGKSAVVKVYFGFSFMRPAYQVSPSAISRVMFSSSKLAKPIRFKVEFLQASGSPGEKPGTRKEDMRRKPGKTGILFYGKDAPAKPIVRCAGEKGGYSRLSDDGTSVLAFVQGAESRAMIQAGPAGYWDFSEYTRALVRIKNTSKTPAVAHVRLDSIDSPTAVTSSAKPLQPGEVAVLEIPFAAKVPWRAEHDPGMFGEVGKYWNEIPGTGTRFRAHKVTSLSVLGDASNPATGHTSFEILGISGKDGNPNKLAWLGTKPPVSGDWKLTLSEEFSGDKLNNHLWNIYWYNWTSPLVHFSKDNIFVKDGNLFIRVTKKRGHHNDDPTDKITDYASGWADTFGKWTQRYGYFEIRCKLPTQPHIWPAFWMMPDRGAEHVGGPGYGVPAVDWANFRHRMSIKEGGMEFDIVEPQSIWGEHRFNVACHWDGYGKDHHRLGTNAIYIDTDEEGFFTVGMLWLPGHVSFWEHGRKFWEWNSPRVSSVQMMLHLQNMMGGWEFDPVDDSTLPADFMIDYIRVWQRADLATPQDGHKENIGGVFTKLPQHKLP